MNKYVTIYVAGQNNIGVIDIGKITPEDGKKKNTVLITERIEPKLVMALQEHFDCTVKIRSVEVETAFNWFGHIKLKVYVVIESDGEDYQEEVILEETWLY
jgi:hypothetical protein